MKLLVAELSAYARYVTREFACIMETLIAVHGWKHIEPDALSQSGVSWSECILRHCGKMPKVILFWEAHEFLGEHEQQLRSLPCEKWIATDDLHHPCENAVRERAFLLCSTVFATYAYCFAAYFPLVADTRRVIWLPHSASPDFDLALNTAPRNQLFLSGAIEDCYPLRTRLNLLMESGFEGIVRQEHPGYHCEYDYGNDDRIGRAYARRIWGYRAAFTDCTTFRYAVAKHFEIPATGALLVADTAIAGPLAELGFVPGVHYFPVSDGDMEDRVRYLLCQEFHPELDEIRSNGQALINERHRTSHRARLIDDLAAETCG
jgi:hypothetical protein